MKIAGCRAGVRTLARQVADLALCAATLGYGAWQRRAAATVSRG